MSGDSHAALTGSDLHENKGVATATNNTVATASGGATVWKLLDASNLSGTGNSFGAQLFHVRDEQTSGTVGPVLTGSTWNTIRFNTTRTSEISSASIGSNQITLPAGTYIIDAFVVFHNQGTQCKVKLYNVTDSVDQLIGFAAYEGNIAVRGKFTLSGTKVLEIRANPGANSSTMPATSSGVSEVYADAMIWKVA